MVPRGTCTAIPAVVKGDPGETATNVTDWCGCKALLLWWWRALGASSVIVALGAMRHALFPRGRTAIHRCLLGDSIGLAQHGVKHTSASVKPTTFFVTEYRTAIKESVLLLARGAKQIRASLSAKEEASAVGVDESTTRLASHRSVVDALST